jgi:transposase
MRSTVQRANGGWFISFTVQRSAKRRQARKPRAVVGVDLGLSRLATLSTGAAAENLRPLRPCLRSLRRLRRQLDRQRRANNPANYAPEGKIKGGRNTWVKSRRMVRTEQRIARLHQRAANVRREQAHRLTTALVREFGVIGIETLAIKNLMGNDRLARHIADVGWGTIITQLTYKTAWSDGSLLVAADRYYPSSKLCSSCGAVKTKLRLHDRVFVCDDDACGYVQDRDLNAALNLAGNAHRHAQAEGIESYVARTGRFTPIARGGQVSLVELDQHSPMKREAFANASQRGDVLAIAA